MVEPIIYRSNPEKKSIISQQGDYTYRQFLQQIQQYALLFETKGYTKVAIYAENRVEWFFAFYAALQNNCIAIPIDFTASTEDVAYILDDCQPELIFLSEAMKEPFSKVGLKSQHKPEVIIFENHPPVHDQDPSGWTGPEDNETTAVIIYTSGTTGSPKGVMLSYTNLLANMKAVIEAKIFQVESQVLILLPLHHIFPLLGSMMVTFYCGGTTVVSPSMQSSDLMKTLADNSVTVLIGVPRLYELIYRGLMAKINKSFLARTFLKLVYATKSRKLGKILFKKVHQGLGWHLQFMVAGGAALNKEVGTFFYAIGFDILEGYGMTEAAPMITFPRPGKIKIGSAGQALPNMTVEIREGEIVAKGPNVMQGYYNRPEETAEVLKDGWLCTGDLGRLDEEGFLYITGRKKEIIVLPNGKNINPVEIEQKLEFYTKAIKEVGVFIYKEMLHAAIVPDYKFLTDNGITDLNNYFREEVLSPFNAELSSYKRIMQFTLVKTELPRTKLSKLQRFKLEELIQDTENKKSKSEDPDSAEYLAVKSFIESQVDMDISPDDHLVFDIAMDSLGKMSLIDFIEQTFGIKIDEEQLLKFPSIAKITEYIGANKLFHREQSETWSDNLKENASVELPKSSFLLKLIVSAVRGFFSIFFKYEVVGLENIPTGPCFIAPNHQTKLDAFLVLSCLDKETLNETYSYAKKDHVKSRIRQALARHTNIIVMDLSKELKESIHKMAEVVKLGKKILIFPEGTRTTTGQLGDFKKTYAILSTELNVPIVPVAISGAYEAMSSGKKKIKSGSKIMVEFLPPVEPAGLTPEALNSLIKSKIYKSIRKN
ncbi:MAG: AMP-binding protein [Bacteroidetes bacterium]|nr:AMP-binding protein [Bacteroidota bacterium]MCL6103433.1 AMP-binding protein [Bacteroidota bacterium]